jgi:hypothetical protein
MARYWTVVARERKRARNKNLKFSGALTRLFTRPVVHRFRKVIELD